MKKILFVCTGNTCRSSMAEGLFNYIVKNETEGLEDYVAVSAGISAFEDDGANPKSIRVLKDGYGIDISSHTAKRITNSDIEDAHIILTMTRDHKDTLMGIFSGAQGKTWTLKEFISKAKADRDLELDIADPYGLPEGVYKKCAGILKDAIDSLISSLKEKEGL